MDLHLSLDPADGPGGQYVGVGGDEEEDDARLKYVCVLGVSVHLRHTGSSLWPHTRAQLGLATSPFQHHLTSHLSHRKILFLHHF